MELLTRVPVSGLKARLNTRTTLGGGIQNFGEEDFFRGELWCEGQHSACPLVEAQ